MSAPQLMINGPHEKFGYDCTDHNDKATVTSSHHAKEQPMSAPIEQAEVSPASTTPATGSATPQLDYNREDVRLSSFDNANWDVPFLDKRKLAQIGFYYIGPQDTVRCRFCAVEIGKWERDDDCFTEHSRWSPNCPLLRRQQTENVPTDAEELNRILPPVTYDTCGLTGGGVLIRPNAYAERSFTPTAENEQSSTSSPRSTPESPEELGSQFVFRASPAQLPAASHHAAGPMLGTSSSMFITPVTTPHLEIEANRLKTFKEWPINLKMKPRELSDAGFFYTGLGDRVQCFSCGGGLKNWENDDVAWEQHALWYPKCEYMKLIKGQKFIDVVQDIHRREQAQGNGDEGEESSEGAEDESTGGSSSSSEAASVNTREHPGGALDRVQDALPSTSKGTGMSRRQKISRRRHVSMSHPEADLKSEKAMLAAKTARPSDVPETKLCKICYESEFNTAFIPCGHVVACAKCASAVTTCPMCREPFDSVTRIYFS